MLLENLPRFSLRLDVLRKRTAISLRFKNEALPVDVYNSYAYIDISVATLCAIENEAYNIFRYVWMFAIAVSWAMFRYVDLRLMS